MVLKFNRELYSKETLFKACYRFTDYAYIHLDVDNEYYYIDIKPKNENDTKDYSNEIKNELLEQANREIVINQTKNIREILYARSMASTVIYTDKEFDIDIDIDDDSAMKDWFDNE